MNHDDWTDELAAALDYDMNEARELYFKQVEGTGGLIRYPAANELLLDIDTDEQFATFERNFGALKRNLETLADLADGALPEISYAASPSASGLPHRHVVVRLPFDVDPWQRIAWQGALGSDPMRELLSAFRLRNGDVHPTVLVEWPDGA